MRGILIIGTDTGVGKTFIAAALARVIHSKGIDVGVMKPFAAARRAFSRRYRSEDAAILARAAHSTDSDTEINSYFYTVPAAPYVASAVTQEEKVSIPTVFDAYQHLAAKHDIMIVEGIGGLMVPLTESETFADFARILNMPTIVVARCSIGTFNHTLMTLSVSKTYDLDVMGLVMNGYPRRQRAEDRQLIIAVKRLAGVEVLCVIPRILTSNIHFKLEEMVVDKILRRSSYS
ncbi:MAG: dethiobiotin synthase [Candidatus Nitrosopolaris sp.]